MEDGHYIAIDWGTTNRRTYLMDGAGAVVDRLRDDHGVFGISPGAFESELAALKARFGNHPVIAAGMVGSTRGWIEVPYVPVPARAADLAAALVRIPDADLMIVPGLAIDTPARSDVMRGEEVQALGACLSDHAPPDALLCQPGTHCKWIDVQDGRIVRFVTSMPGEMFALLRERSILADMLGEPVSDGAAFRAGVTAIAEDGDLLSLLFGIRASVLRDRLPRHDAAAKTSGLLIGADVAARRIAGKTVHLLAEPELGGLYAAAIETCGGIAVPIDGEAAFVTGIHAIWKLRHD